MPVRPQFHEVMSHVVHARLSMDLLKTMILSEMQAGYRPTYRGHEWSHQHFEAVEKMAEAIQVAFDYAKWLQFPEANSRWAEAESGLEALTRDERQGHQHDSGLPAPPETR